MRFPWQKPPAPDEIVAEFIAMHQRLVPDETLVGPKDDGLEWRRANGESHTMMLHKVFEGVARLSKNTRKHRDGVYEGFIQTLTSHDFSIETLSVETHGDQILPNLRSPNYLNYVREKTGNDVPHRVISGDLVMTYGIDLPKTIIHIMAPQSEELGLDEAGLHQRALQNARKLLNKTQFQEAWGAGENLVALPCPDGQAVARLCVLPEYLEDAQSMAVVIPDGALLVLIPIPGDNNWNPLRAMAQNEANSSGFGRPFRVRPKQLEMM